MMWNFVNKNLMNAVLIIFYKKKSANKITKSTRKTKRKRKTFMCHFSGIINEFS